MEETNYLTYDEIPTEVKDAIAKNKTVGVAFVKKDGSVRHMAFRRYLMGYVPSEKEKTEKQLTMRVTHNQMTVYDTNLYIKAYRELQDVDKAAKQSLRVVTLDKVLGFLVGGKFLDMREKNDISERYGEDVYNEITKGMVRAMEKEAQEAETSANELESEVNEQYLNEDKWNRTRFQRLVEVMQKVDPSFKPKLNEDNSIGSMPLKEGRMFFNHILQGSDATEENAYGHASGLDWQEIETSEESYPNLNYVDTVNGVGIWYNYGHDAYYFTDESKLKQQSSGNEMNEDYWDSHPDAPWNQVDTHFDGTDAEYDNPQEFTIIANCADGIGKLEYNGFEIIDELYGDYDDDIEMLYSKRPKIRPTIEYFEQFRNGGLTHEIAKTTEFQNKAYDLFVFRYGDRPDIEYEYPDPPEYYEDDRERELYENKKIKKNSKQRLFEIMSIIDPSFKPKLNENQDDIHSDEFNDDMDSWVKDYEKGFKDIPDDKIAILAQKFVNSEYTKDLMGLNKFIHDNYKKLYLKPESVSKLIDKTGNPDLKNQWIQATK